MSRGVVYEWLSTRVASQPVMTAESHWFWYGDGISARAGRVAPFGSTRAKNARSGQRPGSSSPPVCRADRREAFRFASLFLNNSFTIGTVNTSVFILLLAHRQPRSLLSAAHINVESVLTLCNRAEFHHIFPRAHLDRAGIPKKSQAMLVKFLLLVKCR